MTIMLYIVICMQLLQQIQIVYCGDSSAGACKLPPEIEIIADIMYACPSEYEGKIKTACGDGYHWCNGAYEVSVLGLTRDECRNISPNNVIFVANEHVLSSQCQTYPNDNTNPNDNTFIRFWGCSSVSDPNMTEIESNPCGPLNSAIDLYNNLDNDEITGALCCANSGCYKDIRQQPVIKDKIYACPGIYTDIEHADSKGCGSFYHVCNSAKEVEILGLTNDKCFDIGSGMSENTFYATLEGIATHSCGPGIWGCSSTHDIAYTNTSHECSPLNSVINSNSLSDADGILCCSDGDWIDVEWKYVPYMVQIAEKGYIASSHLCGGSILTLNGHNGNGAILTSALCIRGINSVSDTLYIRIGCTNRLRGCDSDSVSIYEIESFVIHPNATKYRSEYLLFDIAIIYLTEAITNSNAISIIVETDPMIAENNGQVVIIGYGGWAGTNARGGSDMDTLEYTTSNIMTRNECKEYYLRYSKQKSDKKIVTMNTFCVVDNIATNGMTSSCRGDGGSPVLYKGKQVGIVSSGTDINSCDPFYPVVQTYVPSFLQWIISECGPQCGTGEYLGCYNDNISNPALSYQVNDDDTFSIDECRDKCNDNGFKYYALQDNGNKCFCGNNYDSATQYGFKNALCSVSKLGGKLSNSLFVHSGFKQIKYLSDNGLNDAINLRYGPLRGPYNDTIYTAETCRISCSQFKYFSVSSNGECKCDNTYDKSYNNNNKYNKYGLFQNVLIDGIVINVNCDNFLNAISFKNNEYAQYISLSLNSGESYPYDDWTKTQTVTLPNSANCGKVRIECANAANDNGPAGLMVGIKYNKQIISSNDETINNIIKLVDDGIYGSGNNDKIVLSSQTSTTALSNAPYFAKWIWTCGDDGQWEKCAEGLVNTFEIDLCKLSVANDPNFIDFFIPKDKNVIYWILSMIFVGINIVLVGICCCKSSKKYTKVKRVYFDDSGVESDEV